MPSSGPHGHLQAFPIFPKGAQGEPSVAPRAAGVQKGDAQLWISLIGKAPIFAPDAFYQHHIPLFQGYAKPPAVAFGPFTQHPARGVELAAQHRILQAVGQSVSALALLTGKNLMKPDGPRLLWSLRILVLSVKLLLLR